MMAGSELRGLRVLVVEDSYLVAASLRRMIEDMGGEVVGPAATVADALLLVHPDRLDAGILDVNLGSETSEPIAERLHELKLPFVFVTGYASPTLVGSKFRAMKRVFKPVSEPALAAAIRQSIQTGQS